MAKGHRGKPQTAEANNGPAKAKTNNKAADKENSTDTQNLQMSKGRNRRGDKPKLINEEQKPEAVEENSVSLNSNHVSEKKEPGPGVHSKVQPTTEQLMIAKIIDHSASDDPHQRKKIQQVMDVTGKPEDEVATALFDAGWDESRAVELLLEDGDHLSAWEETGKKKKSKKTAVEDNDGWGDDGGNDAGGNGGFQDPRDKRQRGPPRMQRRGRGDSQAKGDRGGDRDRSYAENGDQVVPSGGRGGRRGDQPPRRGGRGGGAGGRGGYSSRTQQSNGGSGPGGSSSGPDPVGFQGSIDTWANPNDQKSTSTENSNNSRGGDRSSREVGGSAPGGEGGGGPGGPRGERPPRGGGRSGRGGGQSGKDAFDNAGNWGDDFPQADDWDNEEYTGSLADTKVFTASGDRGTGQKQRTPPTRPDQQQPQQPQQPQQSLPAAASVANPPQQQQQPGPVGANSQRGYSAAALAASNGPSVTSTYPQSIDLSTLLQKPTTQSSVGSSAAPGAQFNQQATETLKAVVGIGQTSSNTSAAPGSQVAQQQPNPQQPDNSSALYSYAAQASAFSSIKSQGQGRQPPQSKGQGQAPGGGRTGSRMQPPSSSKAPAVEMPGDSLGRLDVQFGGLDLQFGGSGSANSDAMTGSTGFEFGSASTGNQQVDPNDQKTSSGVSVGSLSGGIAKPVTDSFAPTAKEVNKSLSNALSSSGKLNPSAGSTLAAAPVANPTNQQDSFSKSSSSGTAPTANNSSGHVPNLNSHATNVAPGGGSGSGSGSGNNFNKNPGQSDNQGLSGYSTYNNYNKQASGGGYGNSYQQYQQYPNSNSFSSQQQQQQQQQQGSAGQSAGSSSQYKGVGQYDKYDPSLSNPAAAVLGLANTNTTNALSGKVSATTASKVNMPNLPPGVASMLHPQYVAAAGLAPAAAFYGLQQPMYGAYGNTGLEDLAAMQRASASAAGLHTLPTTGYYDPNNQFAATSLGAAVPNRDAGQNSNIASQLAGLVSSASSVTGGAGNGNSSSAVNTLGSTSGFGSTSGATSTAAVAAAAASAAAASSALAVNNAADSTSSPGPATSTGSSQMTGSGQHHSVQQQAQQQQQQQQQTAFNLAATNAFAAQQMPPGYAYYFGNMGNMSLQGYPQTPQGHVQYQPQAMTVPGAGTTPSQFQKQTYGTSYGSGYDTLGQQQQQGNAKDFSSNYSSNGQSKSTGGSAAAGTGKGAHQYWGNTLTSTQLW